jgi:ribosome-binding factor A
MAQRQKHHKLPKQIQRQILNYPQNDGIYDDSTIKAMRKERAVSNARVFFTSMVLLLGLAVLSAKGVEAH